MNLEVGMYVRTKEGITQFKEYDTSNGKLLCMPLMNGTFANIEDILKASNNIIDLIEVGDYVNGMRVKNIMSVGTSQYVIKKGDDKYVCCGDYGLMDDGSGRSCYALQWNNNQIKEVLTHEQYEANCYKVGE